MCRAYDFGKGTEEEAADGRHAGADYADVDFDCGPHSCFEVVPCSSQLVSGRVRGGVKGWGRQEGNVHVGFRERERVVIALMRRTLTMVTLWGGC